MKPPTPGGSAVADVERETGLEPATFSMAS